MQWPAVILEGLNYKFEAIAEIVTNFKISNEDTMACYDNMLRVVNEASLVQNCSESNIRAEIS